MTAPTPGSPPGRPPSGSVTYSARTKIIVVVVLVVAVGGFVLAGLSADTSGDPTFTVSGSAGEQVTSGNGVEALVPGDGDEVLGQQRFGIDLEPGWTGELVLLPSNGPATALPEDELEVVEELNQIFYQPMPGKSIERLGGGTNCVAATIWDRVRGRDATERVETWCFSVA